MEIDRLRTLWRLSFGDTEEFLDLFFSTAYDPRRCRCIRVDGTIAAALYWFGCTCGEQKLAYLYAVATHPDFRGQGLCRRLMAETHSHLAERGYDGTLLVPETENLRQMYRRLGYRDCTAVSEFTCSAGDSSTPLRPVTTEEYAVLRREQLPALAVLQERENLAFLEKQVRFYAAPGLLLAAAKEGNHLAVPELLGAAAAAPGILKALNCTTGAFRTPGQNTPFAMFRPLTPDAQPPAYFGFAFD